MVRVYRGYRIENEFNISIKESVGSVKFKGCITKNGAGKQAAGCRTRNDSGKYAAPPSRRVQRNYDNFPLTILSRA